MVFRRKWGWCEHVVFVGTGAFSPQAGTSEPTSWFQLNYMQEHRFHGKLRWMEMDRFHWVDLLCSNEVKHRLQEVRKRTKEIQRASFHSLNAYLDTGTGTFQRNNITFQTQNSIRRKCKSKWDSKKMFVKHLWKMVRLFLTELFFIKCFLLLKCSTEGDFDSSVPNTQKTVLVTFSKKRKFGQKLPFSNLKLKSLLLVKKPFV